MIVEALVQQQQQQKSQRAAQVTVMTIISVRVPVPVQVIPHTVAKTKASRSFEYTLTQSLFHIYNTKKYTHSERGTHTHNKF